VEEIDMELNATYLFKKKPFRNSERFWAAYFGLFLLQESQSAAPRDLPVYSCDANGHLTQRGTLSVSRLAYENVIADGKLTGEPFGLKDWPNEILNLQIDVVVLKPEQKVVHFIEVKTVGADVKRNFLRYPIVCDTVRKAHWESNLHYLVSHGHETQTDWPLLAEGNQGRSRILLWEDIFRFVEETPLGKMLAVGKGLSCYATAPELCNCQRT
jgi:hypothetical protein